MSEHHAAVVWRRAGADFTYEGYSRDHDMVFKDGRIVMAASAAPSFRGDAARVDPEEAFVAALASCHILSFLAICARGRIAVDAYEDAAIGYLEKGENGKLWMARVVLRPRVRFGPGCDISAKMLAGIHRDAHEDCFIARSVNTNVTVTLPD